MIKFTFFSSTLFLFLTSIVFSQQNFDDYKTMRSLGDMPVDFSYLTSEKIKDQMGKTNNNLSKHEEKVFLEGIYYGIDQLLHSGMVIYGDEISTYVREIAEKLVKSKFPELKNKLRFYTIKSNESNALSTDQGIVFVTTGLIAQLTSEAQLAFILAHEISHYTEHHVVETFEYKNHHKNHGEGIRNLSIYSKEKETEADKLGVGLYCAAGYAKEELLPTFDVLIYSYLPFEEIEFPKSYFNSPLMYVPENLFPKKKYDIKAIEDYDDSNSSHPNIKKRKDEVALEIQNLKNWGTTVSFFGEDRFNYIRKLSRYETIRTDILEAQYADAMYSIFVLEKENPNSLYLKRMKAHCWLGLAQYKNAGRTNDIVDKTADFEGEIAVVHYFIKQLKQEASFTLALREIQNIRKTIPNDEEINVIWDRMLKLVASTSKFDLDKYSDISFETAAKNFINTQVKDTVISTDKSKLNKYDKIKNKKNNIDPTVFDSSKFYYYGLNDLIKDDAFKTRFKGIKDSLQKAEKEKEMYDNLSTYEKRKLEKQKINNLKEFILVEPSAISYKNSQINYNASNRLELKYTEAINSASKDLGMTIYTINSEALNKIGTIGFNERSTLTGFLMQVSHNEEVDVLPVDYQQLREIETNYGTSKVIFTIVEHTYKPQFSLSAFYLIFYPPAILAYLPVPFMKGNQTELNLIVLDTKKAIIEQGFSYYFDEPINKFTLKARMYDIFQSVKLK